MKVLLKKEKGDFLSLESRKKKLGFHWKTLFLRQKEGRVYGNLILIGGVIVEENCVFSLKKTTQQWHFYAFYVFCLLGLW